MTTTNKENFKFAWRIIVAHVIAYFIAGLSASNLFNYGELFASNTLSLLMRPVTEPVVALGGGVLQIIRGIIMALVLLPIRKVFTEEKCGFLKLGLLILGLSVMSTFAAATGSVDGFIYTKLSFAEHVIGYFEAALWIFLFVGILWTFYKFEKRAINITALVLFILIILMSIAGYFAEDLNALQNS